MHKEGSTPDGLARSGKGARMSKGQFRQGVVIGGIDHSVLNRRINGERKAAVVFTNSRPCSVCKL